MPMPLPQTGAHPHERERRVAEGAYLTVPKTLPLKVLALCVSRLLSPL
jgi:hypothetical protein